MLVTGADGFTGQHIILRASRAGYEIHSLKSDLKDAASVKAEILIVKPEVVVHLAAISFVGHADAGAFYDVNVIGTLNLLDALVSLPQVPKKILLASSANVYGNCKHSPIAESQAPMPVNHYAMSKLAMEYMARNYLEMLPIFFTRPFNYIGLGQAESFVIPKLISHFKCKAGVVELGNIDIEREFNDVNYVCDAYLALLEAAEPGEVYNICSGKAYDLKTIIAILGKITGQQIEVKINPAFVRQNEVRRLTGDPRKLQALIDQLGISLTPPTIEETLKKMF